MKKNILFLTPFAIVKEFHFPLVALAKTLRKEGYQITMVHCRQAMKADCTAMMARGVGQDGEKAKKDTFCRQCFQAATIASMLYPWETRWLHPQSAYSGGLKPIAKDELWRMAGYEIVLSHKISEKIRRQDVPKSWQQRYNYLKELMPQGWDILKNGNFLCLISYNSLYGVHHLFAKLGSRLNVSSLCLHQSFNMNIEDEYILMKNNVTEFLASLQKKVRSTSYSIPRSGHQKIQNHTLGLFVSKKPWAYSEPKKTSLSFQTEKRLRKKILVLLSSPDELAGLKLLHLLPQEKNHPFKDQIGWLRWIFSMAQKYPMCEFHIRPHPRLYPNKRDKTTAEFSIKLEEIKTKNRAPNIVWPSRELQGSVWDHLENTDLVFNAWSTVGETFAQNHIPIFTFFPQFANSGNELGFTGRTPQAYEDKFQMILKGRLPKGTRKQAIRWLSAFLCTNNFFLKWKYPLWIRLMRKLIPRKWGDRFDLPTFIFASIQSDSGKILKIIKGL